MGPESPPDGCDGLEGLVGNVVHLVSGRGVLRLHRLGLLLVHVGGDGGGHNHARQNGAQPPRQREQHRDGAHHLHGDVDDRQLDGGERSREGQVYDRQGALDELLAEKCPL